MSELLKKCSSCQENKELAYFSKHAACKMGVSHICRECDKLKAQARRLRIAALLSDLPASSSSEYSSIMEGEKFCSQCSVSKPLDLFRKDPKSGMGSIKGNVKTESIKGKYISHIIIKELKISQQMFEQLNPDFDKQMRLHNQYNLTLPEDIMLCFNESKSKIMSACVKWLIEQN